MLLLHRFNTGYEDGNYSVVVGHMEAGQTVTQAAAREAQEETDMAISPEDITDVQVMHRKSKEEKIEFFVLIERWQGEITN